MKQQIDSNPSAYLGLQLCFVPCSRALNHYPCIFNYPFPCVECPLSGQILPSIAYWKSMPLSSSQNNPTQNLFIFINSLGLFSNGVRHCVHKGICAYSRRSLIFKIEKCKEWIVPSGFLNVHHFLKT